MTTKQSRGRFRKPMDPEALAFSTSLRVDRRLYREDIAGSIAHVRMLGRQRIITSRDAAAIVRALKEIEREIDSGRFILSLKRGSKKRFALDDVHMAIEQRLFEKVGTVGGLLHTARSRNDQIALDERLYLRTQVDHIIGLLRQLQRVLAAQARRNETVVMPGYTHLQRGQPVLLAHHLLAYVSMLDRDRERLDDMRKRVARSPLGAAALAGTSFPIDRAASAVLLGMDALIENSIDAVSDRDVLIEIISAGAIIMMHLSRLAEELVLWSSAEWRFAKIGEEFTTGSSIMPQKQNPDMAELVRGKTGRVYGDLMALLTVMKGLPLAYNRDMQEDKEPLFDAVDTVTQSLSIMARMLKTVKFNVRRFEQEMRGDFLMATEIADYLARKGMPFRAAHGVAGAVVQECQTRGCTLADLPISHYREHSTLFGEDVFTVLDPRESIGLKRSAGSTSPREVSRALARWEKRLRS
jgi:argininosuccinate lyase